MWTGKNHSKLQRVEADLFENGGKISPFSDKNRYLWTGPEGLFTWSLEGERPQVGEVTCLSIYSLILS